MGSENFIVSLLTSIGSCGIIGFLFFSWLNAKFEKVEEIKERLAVVEQNQFKYLSKEDHKSDSARVEKDIEELKIDIKEMPQKIVDLLKPFINR